MGLKSCRPRGITGFYFRCVSRFTKTNRDVLLMSIRQGSNRPNPLRCLNERFIFNFIGSGRRIITSCKLRLRGAVRFMRMLAVAVTTGILSYGAMLHCKFDVSLLALLRWCKRAAVVRSRAFVVRAAVSARANPRRNLWERPNQRAANVNRLASDSLARVRPGSSCPPQTIFSSPKVVPRSRSEGNQNQRGSEVLRPRCIQDFHPGRGILPHFRLALGVGSLACEKTGGENHGIARHHPAPKIRSVKAHTAAEWLAWHPRACHGIHRLAFLLGTRTQSRLARTRPLSILAPGLFPAASKRAPMRVDGIEPTRWLMRAASASRRNLFGGTRESIWRPGYRLLLPPIHPQFGASPYGDWTHGSTARVQMLRENYLRKRSRTPPAGDSGPFELPP